MFLVFRTVLITILLIGGPSSFAESISRYLFGQNHWLGEGDEGRPGYLKYLWPKVKESGVTMIRIGGNNYEKHFPQRDQLNSMIDNIHSIGAEPLLQVPRYFTALQAQELVEYYTKTSTRRVQFWSIGNEPLLHDKATLKEVHIYLVRILSAMREVSSDIKIFAFDEATLKVPEFTALIGGELDITGLKKNGHWLLDGVTFHNYPNGKEFTRDDVVFAGPQKILGQIITLKGLIAKANTKHHRTGAEALLWGLTELNVTWKNPNREISGYGNPSFLGGQFIAEIFGYGMQYGAYTVNYWCINEIDRIETDFGYIGMPREFHPRSSYYHMQMMSANMKGAFVPSKDNQDYIKTIATLDEKTIAVMVLNQHLQQDYPFELKFNSNGFTSTPPLMIGVDVNLQAKFSGIIPAQTTKLLIFNRNGELQKTIVYDLANNLKDLPPIIK